MSAAEDSRGGRTLSKLGAISSLTKTQLYFHLSYDIISIASYHLLDHSISIHHSVFDILQNHSSFCGSEMMTVASD